MAQLSMKDFKNYTFPTELKAAAQGNRLAWALEENGVRNVYVAAGPDFAIRKLTSFSRNDGQEITGLQFSPDGDRKSTRLNSSHSSVSRMPSSA